jgi:hypothetical protein
MPITGGLAELNRLGRRIRRTIEAPRAVAAALAPLFAAQVRQTFTTHTDLYGRAWEPWGTRTNSYRGHKFGNGPSKNPAAAIARHKGQSGLLVRTGAMRDGFSMSPMANAIRVRIGVAYARYHISTGRAWLPLFRKLPIRWRAMIVNETERQLTRAMEAA